MYTSPFRRAASTAGVSGRKSASSCLMPLRQPPRTAGPSRPVRYADCHTGSRTHRCGQRTAHHRTPPSPRAATHHPPAGRRLKEPGLPRTRRSRLLRGHLQQPKQPGVLRPQPCQLSLNHRRDLSGRGHAIRQRSQAAHRAERIAIAEAQRVSAPRPSACSTVSCVPQMWVGPGMRICGLTCGNGRFRGDGACH